MEKDFEDVVKETLNRLYEEEGSEDNGQPEQNPEEPQAPDEPQEQPQGQEDDQDGNQENDKDGKGDEENGEETFSAEDLGDFLKKTESKISVKKEGCMPSPIFGNRDTSNHNKFRVYIENPKGRISFIFWDSTANTEKNNPLNPNEALADFGKCVSDYENNPSFEEFKEAFGYDETEENLAQKAYNGCRKMMDKAKKIFDDVQLEELKRLASEY